jgi:hypothetical protein
VLDLKFAIVWIDSERTSNPKSTRDSNVFGVAEDSEIRSEPAIGKGEFPIATPRGEEHRLKAPCHAIV